MIKHKRTFFAFSSIMLALVIGAAALFTPSTVYAQTLTHGGPGGEGMMGMHGVDDTYLAQALGITTDALATAKEAAWVKIIDQALADGLITEAQATSLKSDSTGFNGRGHGLGGWLIHEANVDYDTALAEQLGITTAELETARIAAQELRLQDAVDSGDLTTEQADLMRAHMAVRSYIDRETMLANALGISVDELQAARDAGKSTSDLITELGLTTENVTAALKTALETAVNQAVTDGKITQAQADLLMADSRFTNMERMLEGPHGFGDPNDGMMGGGRHRGGHGMHGGDFTPPTTDDTTTDTDG